MRQRTSAIAALLILVLTLPLPRACAMVAHAAQGHHGCCAHQAMTNACGGSKASLCCAASFPVDSATFPVHNVVPVVLTTQTTAAYACDRLPRPESGGLAHTAPVQHEPPGLLIAKTVVLRI
jgi:hypothetical protein